LAQLPRYAGWLVAVAGEVREHVDRQIELRLVGLPRSAAAHDPCTSGECGPVEDRLRMSDLPERSRREQRAMVRHRARRALESGEQLGRVKARAYVRRGAQPEYGLGWIPVEDRDDPVAAIQRVPARAQ